MKLRIVWSVIGILFVTLIVAGFAHAQTSKPDAHARTAPVLPPITEVGDPGLSELEFQNELQVAAVIGTQTGSAAAIAAAAAKETAANAAKETAAADQAVTTENLELKTEAADAAVVTGEAPVAKSEAEIPVKLDQKIVAKTENASLRDLLLVFAVLAGFGVLAYLAVSKFKYRNRKAAQFDMKVLAQHHLGPKKSLAVVRVAGESLLIGVTDHHISMIKSLALLDEDEPGAEPADFRAGLESLFSRQQNAVSSGRETQTRDVTGDTAKISFRVDENADGEDFTISKIRDVVSKQIRNMKALE